MRQDEAPLGSTISTGTVSSLRPRRRTDSAVPAQPPNLLSHRMRDSPSATDSTSLRRPYSQLSTKGLSNSSLGEIRTRRGLRREETAGEKNMTAGDPRDEPMQSASPAAAAAAAAATANRNSSYNSFNNHIPSSSSHLKSSQSQSQSQSQSPSNFDSPLPVPRRKRALTSHNATVQSPFLPESRSSPSSAAFHDTTRRSVPTLNLSNVPTGPSSSRPLSPLSAVRRNRISVLSDSASLPFSPNARKRSEPSVHVAHQVRPDVKSTMPSTVTYDDDRTLTGRTIRTVNGPDKAQDGGASTPTADAKFKNEDVFLNIARSDSDRRGSVGRSDFRRSRYRFSTHSLRSPTSADQTPSPDQLRFNNYDSPLHSNDVSPSVHYSAVAPSSASAHPLDDNTRSRHGFGSRSTIGVPHSRFSHASPETSPRSPAIHPNRRSSLHDSRSFRNSTLSTIRSSRQPSGTDATERVRVDQERPRQDGTESTVSTAAPSTVWDELDDLKSRIRKLELTGKLPPSSQEAMSSAERPRTAATTATAISSSASNDRRVSNPSAASDAATTASQVHPLLQSALAKGKNVLSREVYNALEITVTDALKLSTILASNAPSGNVSVANGYSPADRHARRKADSVCRSLTELCLALSEEKLQLRPSSRDERRNSQPPNGIEEKSPAQAPYLRSGSHEPEETVRRRSTTSRLPSRLDTRVSSLANVANGPQSAAADSKQTPSPSSEVPTRRLSRLSTSSRTRRLQMGDDNEPDPPTRSVSRAGTEIGPPATPRIPPRQRISHEYRASANIRPQQNTSPTSHTQSQQQPQIPRTPSVSQSGIPSRRGYITPATSYTPATSRSSIQAGSRRYGLTSSFTPSPADVSPADNTSLPRPSQPEPSQTRIIAPSSKIASSYTPIHQNRIRTNSLGARRFGMRSRPVSTVNDYVHNLDDSID